MIVHEELASVGQRMIWLVGHYRAGEGRLNYPLLLRLRGPLDVVALHRALDQLVARHEALRTTFTRRRGLLTQLVHAPEPVPVISVALLAESELPAHVRRETTTSIDPVVSPIRVTLWAVGDQDHLLCVNAHHLVTDAWSCRILTEELIHLLASVATLPRVQWQYRHFVRWQRRRSTAERLRADGAYWRDRLDGVARSSLSRGANGSAAAPTSSQTIRLDIDRPTADQVRELARREQTTPFAVLLAAYYLALHQEGGQLDLSVGAPFANRLRPETAGTVGLFANLVILRTRLDAGITFADVLRRTRRTVNEAIAHQQFPYYLLPLDTDPTRSNRFDDVIFQMLPELPAPIRLGGLDVEVVPPELASRFDLELAVVPHRDGFNALLQYARQRISGDVAERLAHRFRTTVTRLSSIFTGATGQSTDAFE